MDRRALETGWFLALRQIRRSNPWTTGLIIFVMMLTFLNLVVVSGILVGLIEGSTAANKAHYSGDLIISNLPERSYVERTREWVALAESYPGVEAVSTRYIESGRVEAGYRTRTDLSELLDSTGGLVAGINPSEEDAVTQLSTKLIEGEYLTDSDEDKILIGSDLLFAYSPIDSPGFRNLKKAGLGDRVRLKLGGFSKEVTIKGILKSKVGEIDSRIFAVDRVVRNLIGRTDFNADEIVIRLKSGVPVEPLKQTLLAAGAGEFAKVQTAAEAEPKFLKDIKSAFALLGNLIGSVGLAVASITIFIVVFVNAITRRKYIGILKGIGIRSSSIEFAYVL